MQLLLKFIFLFFVAQYVFTFRCDRRPYGSLTHPSAPDGRFKLEVEGADETYIPNQLYTVRITETDGESRFTGFMISAEGEVRQDPKNPRKMITLSPGDVTPRNYLTTKFSNRCHFSVEHAVGTPKSSAEVYWHAPASGNGCVTLRAMVAENKESWYEDGGPLSLYLCEDMRQPDDITPQVNYNCEICDEAKYEITFTGIWSRNTHPRFYPENDWLPRYSDLVGASHAADVILWAPGSLITDGVKDVAEYANTTRFEQEIREKIGSGVRTLIKGKGHGYLKMNYPTYSFIRTDKVNHLITAAVGIHPSPDWFLGVSRFELCQGDSWLTERELNLYPWDAGTDNGVSYESANFPTFPQAAVSRVETSSYDKHSPFYEMDMKEMHPFGTLRIKLVKTYQRDCTSKTNEEPSESSTTTEEGTSTTEQPSTESEGLSEPEEPSSQPPLVTDPESSEDCPMTQWLEWTPCDGPCENGRVSGFQWRERFHLVDGVAVEKYDPNVDPSTRKEVPRFCKNHYEDFERRECEDDCDEEQNEVAR